MIKFVFIDNLSVTNMQISASSMVIISLKDITNYFIKITDMALTKYCTVYTNVILQYIICVSSEIRSRY